MFTKERDGGNMMKKIEKIIISPEGIDVISNINGVNNVTQINLNGSPEEIQEILEKHKIIDVLHYEFDEKILRALAIDDAGEQLKDYLELCRQVSYGGKKLEIAQNMPEIEYDLRGLRTYE